MKARWLLSVMLMAGVVLFTGCSNDTTAEDVAKMNTSNITRVANLYSAYQHGYGQGGGSGGPKDEADFKKYITGYPAEKLKMMSVDPANLDALFKSERDGKPFKIKYKVPGGRGAVAPVVFEAEGKDGKKQVGFTGGSPKVEDCDQAAYDGYWSGKEGKQGPGNSSGPPAGGGRPGGGGPPPGAPTGPPM
jgi:hypothetical protein